MVEGMKGGCQRFAPIRIPGCEGRARQTRTSVSERSALFGLSPQSIVRVLDKQIADRETAPLGLGGESLGQLGGEYDGAMDAIVALPDLVRYLRQAPSSRLRRALSVP